MRPPKRSPFGLVVLLLVTLLLVGGAGGWWYLNSLLSPANPADSSATMFVVQKGEGFNSIAAKLAAAGLIKSPLSLKLAAYQTNKGKNIQAGSFRLSASMSPAQILEELAHGKLDLWVTVLEGWRREEIAENIAQTFADNNQNFDPNKFLTATRGKEGYLFPDTYLFPLNTSEAAVASIMESTLDKKLSPELKAAIAKSGHTLPEILTMASIIEREAKTTESRKMISGILWKRLQNEWPLQVDATLQYAKGYDKTLKDWWKSPEAVDKNINSPYNTYKNPGLPPGPICSPSFDSIQAAVYPTASAYWYYLTDNQGTMHYAETIQGHNQNIATYLR